MHTTTIKAYSEKCIKLTQSEDLIMSQVTMSKAGNASAMLITPTDEHQVKAKKVVANGNLEESQVSLISTILFRV